MQQRTRVVGYIRVSTEGQADAGVSLDAQRAKVQAYCDLYELDLVTIEADEGVGAKSLNRPGLHRALTSLREGRADALLVTKLDRLTRSVRDLGELVETYFADGRYALLSVADSIDTRSAAGRLVLNVLASVAQWEREATGERTKDALAHLQAQGVHIGRAPFGVVHSDAADDEGRRILVEVDAEVETIRAIRAMRAEGRSLRAICAALTEGGYGTKRGGQWSPKVVRSILARPSAA